MELGDCILSILTSDLNFDSFDCDKTDLNEFLKEDAIPHMDELIGVTYVFTPASDPKEIVCFFTVSNDLLQLKEAGSSKKSKIKKAMPRAKHRPDYPSVKIGRLGVNKQYHGSGISHQLMDFIKGWFRFRNKTGCRFVIVDAYNENKVLRYYEKNDFDYLLSEEKEKEININRLDEDGSLKTRLMFFDLARLSS